MALSWEWFLRSTFAINLMTGRANVEPQFSEIHVSPHQRIPAFSLVDLYYKEKYIQSLLYFFNFITKNFVEIQDRPVRIIKLTL